MNTNPYLLGMFVGVAWVAFFKPDDEPTLVFTFFIVGVSLLVWMIERITAYVGKYRRRRIPETN